MIPPDDSTEAPEPAPGPPEASVDRAGEIRAAIAAEREKKNSTTKNLTLFLVTGLVYLSVVGWELDPVSIGIFLGVLLFHEAGHAAAMVVFGYRNLSMFFVPFLGALMTGRKDDAPAWQEALVSLAGPLPGLFVGIALLPITASDPGGHLTELTGYLLVLNGFNLLPFMPLDGGHFASAVLFQRHRHVETVFSYLGALGLVFLAFALDWWAIGIFAVFAFMAANHQRKVREVAHELGQSHGERVSEPDDEMLVTMDDAVRERLKIATPQVSAQVVEQIRQASRRRAPGALATALLLGLYLVPLPVTAVSAVVTLVVNWPDTEFYADGTMKRQGDSVDGEPEGYWTTYHPNAEVESEGEYRAGEKIGEWKYFDSEGEPTSPP